MKKAAKRPVSHEAQDEAQKPKPPNVEARLTAHGIEIVDEGKSKVISGTCEAHLLYLIAKELRDLNMGLRYLAEQQKRESEAYWRFNKR